MDTAVFCPIDCWISTFHSRYFGLETVFGRIELKSGIAHPGAAAWYCARFCPPVNALLKAVLQAAICAPTGAPTGFATSAGDIGIGFGRRNTNRFEVGEFRAY